MLYIILYYILLYDVILNIVLDYIYMYIYIYATYNICLESWSYCQSRRTAGGKAIPTFIVLGLGLDGFEPRVYGLCCGCKV